MLGKILILVLLLVAIPVQAQDTTPPAPATCTAEQLEPLIVNWQIATTRLDEGYASGDVQQMYEAFLELDLVTDMLRSLCNPLQWQGSGDQVLDPIFLQPGNYAVTFSSELGASTATAAFDRLGPGCDTPLLALNPDEGLETTEELLRSNNCSLIPVIHSPGEWSLVIQKIS